MKPYTRSILLFAYK